MVIALGAAIISFRVSTPEHTLSSMLSSLGEAIREFKEGLHGNK